MADAPTTTEITQYKKNVVVLPTAYLKDRGSANLRMFLRKENSGTIFFIGNDPTNNALKLPYNVPCHNNKLAAASAATGAPPAPIIANSQLDATGHYNRAAPIDVANNTEAVNGAVTAAGPPAAAAQNTIGYDNIRNFCPDLRCVANEPTDQNNHKITNSGDHTSNFRIYLPNYEDDSQLEGCNFEFIIVCNNSQLERDKQLGALGPNLPNDNRASNFLGDFGGLAGADLQKQIAELGGIYENDRPDSIGSANIEIISHSYITQMYESFAKEKEFHEAFPIPCKFTPYTDDPLTTKAYIHQLCNDDNYAKPDLYGFSPQFVAATHQSNALTSLTNEINGLGITTDNYNNKYGIHADFRPTNDGDRSIYDRLNTQGKRIPNKKIAGITHNGGDYTLSQFFNIYKNALNDTTNRVPELTGDIGDGASPGINNDVKTAMNFKENPKITNSSLSTEVNTKDNFLNVNGAGRGVVDKRNIFADNVTTSYEPDLPCYGIDINPEEKHLSHRQANMVGTIHCRGSKAFSNNPDSIFAANNAIMGDIAGPEVKDGLNPIIPVYNTLRHNDKGTDMQSGLGTPCDGEKPFHTIHINLNRLKYSAHNADNDQPAGEGRVANLVGDVTTVAFADNTLKGILNIIPQINDAGNDNNNNYNSVSNTADTVNTPKALLREAYPNKYAAQDAPGGTAHEPLYDDGNPASLFGLHSKDTGRGTNVANVNTKSPAPPLHHPFMRPFGTAGGGAGDVDPFVPALEQQDATAVGGTQNLATPDIITTQQKTYADHRQSCVNKQIHIKCNYLEGQWHVEVITPNVHTLGGNQLLHQNPGFRDITFVRGRK